MSSRQKRTTSAIALFLVFAAIQVYVGVSYAWPRPVPVTIGNSGTMPQQATGMLMTEGNKAITVNGASATTGATILTSANIETPAGVGATVNIAGIGSVQIQANTKLTMEFQQGSLNVLIFKGCVTLHVRKRNAGEIDNSKGLVGKTDPAKDGVLKACAPGDVATAPPSSPSGGLSSGAIIAIVAGGGALAVIALAAGGGTSSRGSNPSP